MSRSYRKHTIIQDNSYKKFGKKFANRKVRRKMNDTEFTCSFGGYKKLYESWNIADYKWGYLCYRSFYHYNRPYYDSDQDCWNAFKRIWKCK